MKAMKLTLQFLIGAIACTDLVLPQEISFGALAAKGIGELEKEASSNPIIDNNGEETELVRLLSAANSSIHAHLMKEVKDELRENEIPVAELDRRSHNRRDRRSHGDDDDDGKGKGSKGKGGDDDDDGKGKGRGKGTRGKGGDDGDDGKGKGVGKGMKGKGGDDDDDGKGKGTKGKG
uniref:Uncharacterized protein n=1 Tax=Pseudo-nitzschia australis TaxID=44445 RepID=A0A7S4AJW2_9STRA